MYAHVAADHGLVEVHEGRDWSPETARRRVSRPEGRYSMENSQCTLKVSEKATLTEGSDLPDKNQDGPELNQGAFHA